jgi:hypothetical protein
MNSQDLAKVDVEDLLKNFRIQNVKMFSAYLKEVWRVKFNFYF